MTHGGSGGCPSYTSRRVGAIGADVGEAGGLAEGRLDQRAMSGSGPRPCARGPYGWATSSSERISWQAIRRCGAFRPLAYWSGGYLFAGPTQVVRQSVRDVRPVDGEFGKRHRVVIGHRSSPGVHRRVDVVATARLGSGELGQPVCVLSVGRGADCPSNCCPRPPARPGASDGLGTSSTWGEALSSPLGEVIAAARRRRGRGAARRPHRQPGAAHRRCRPVVLFEPLLVTDPR
jgi:hypothetical protein